MLLQHNSHKLYSHQASSITMIYKNLLNFVETNTSQFDESHDVNHALAVYNNAIDIASHELPGFDDDIIQYSSLLHDVCDHKYENSISKAELNDFIKSQLSPQKAMVVIDIINNISYSQELKGLRRTLEPPYNIYQDIVSDADKLEALGQVGLQRCITFTLERNGVVPQDVIIHCHEKLLHLKDNFIRTTRGRLLAIPLHNVIAEYCDS
jgi:uncharacterized protein